MTRVRINTAARAFAVFALAAGLAAVPIAVHAQQTPAGQEQPAARATPDRLVTLPTGERVFLAPGDRAVRSILPAPRTTAGPAAEPTRVRTMAVGDHFYVVPGAALPYLGRQLDLALFDVLAPADAIQVDWQSAARPVPGLDLEPAVGGRSTGRISDPAAFGAAARPGRRADRRPCPRARRPRPQPTAAPQYPIATLTVKGLDALGAPAFSGSVSVTNAEDNQRFSTLQSFVQGEPSLSVPVGHYSLGVSITTLRRRRQVPRRRPGVPARAGDHRTADRDHRGRPHSPDRGAGADHPPSVRAGAVAGDLLPGLRGRHRHDHGVRDDRRLAGGVGDAHRAGQHRRGALVHVLPAELAGRHRRPVPL